MPGKYKAIQAAYEKGDNIAASAMQAEVNAIIDVLIKTGVNPGIKYLLSKRGIPCGDCRPPFGKLTEESIMLLDGIEEKVFA